MLMKSIIRYMCILAIAMMPVLAFGQSVVDTVPYHCDFEDTVQNTHWHLANGACYNYFVIDTQTNITPDGFRSLYVTEQDQAGHPYSYKPGSSVAGDDSYVASRVFAWIEIHFPDTGLFDIGFWWNCYGETVYDYGRIILAPTTYTFTASTLGWDTSSPYPGEYLGAVSTPSNCVSLNGTSPLSNVTSPQYRNVTVHITTAGNYRLGIMWLNDGNTGDQPPLMIDDISIVPHTCDIPTNLLVDHFTNDTVFMRWDNTSSSYIVMWDTAGVTSNYTHVDTVYTNEYVIGGLPDNGEYEFVLTGLCIDETSMPVTYHIIMPDNSCAPITTMPYTFNFDTATSIGTNNTPPVIPCWGHLSNSSNSTYSGYPYLTASYAHSGTYSLYFTYSTTYVTRCGYHLPRLDPSFDLSGVLVSFYATNSSPSTYAPRIMVGVMSDPSNINTFVACDTVDITSGTTTLYTVPLSNYTGNGRYVALLMTTPGNTYDYAYAYVDDITLLYEPCVRPGVTVLNVTDTSAHIEWAPTNGYYYEWAMSTADTATVTRSNDTVLDLTNLSPSTYYTVYLRSVCDDAGGWNPVTFRTNCGPLRSLPFREDFENALGGSSTTAGSPFIDCWERLVNGTYWYPYVYNYASYAHSGSTSLYWYRGSTADYGYTSYVILPGIDTNYIDMRDVVFKFWGMSSSTSYGPTLEVGVLDSINDTASFQLVANVDIEDAFYREYAVPMRNYTGSGTNVAVRAVLDGQYWYAYLDDFSLEMIPACPQITNLFPLGVSTTSAYIAWNTSDALDTASMFEIGVVDVDSVTAPISYLTTEHGYFVTGLMPHTSYIISVRTMCDTSNSDWVTIEVTTGNLPCIEFDTSTRDSITFMGTGNTTSSYYLPLNNFYNYSYTQQLIEASEINGATMVTGIDFQYNGSSASTVKTNCTIYLANAAANSLASGFVPFDNTFTPVYSGPMNCSSGWNHFEFTTPFAYDGSSSLLIAVLDNSGSYNGNAYTFACHNANNMARHIYQDGSAYNPATVSGGTVLSYRNNMRLHTLGCSLTGQCSAPNVIVDNVGEDEISIIWAAGGNESSWDVEYKADSDTGWTSAGLMSSTNYTFTGLNSNTTYTIRVTALCSANETPSAMVIATTSCAGYPVPFFENFQTWPTSSSAPAPSCWHKFSTYSANYPYTSSSYNHGSGTRSLYFYNYGGTHTCLVLPRFDAPIDSLEISFYMYKNNNSYRHELRVGVMTDPTDISTFEIVGRVYPEVSGSWCGVSVPFNTYSGQGKYIAIRTAPGYSYPYIDDITVKYINPCPRPTNFWEDNVTATSATIHWEDTLATNFEVEWGPIGFTPGTGTTLSVSEDSVNITGLVVNSQYDIYVRAICSEGDTSDWSFAHTFWSGCLVIDSLPFFENFESYPGAGSSDPDFIHCWTRLTGNSYFYPYLASSSTYSHSGGSRGLYWYCTNSTSYYYGNTMSEYVVLPEVDTTILPINTLMLSFWAKSSSSSYHPYIAIGVMSDPTDPSTFVAVDTIDFTSTSWENYEIPFNNFTGSGSYIALRGLYVSYWYAYVDEIKLDLMPSCVTPNHLTSTGNTLNSVDLTWNERGEATEWQIAYDTTASSPAYDTTVYSTSATIGGLYGGVTYHFYVRSICGPGDTSAWSDVYSIAPGSWNMRVNMTDTVHMCQGVIYDDGGPNAYYSDGQTSTVIIYPDAPGNVIQIQGTFSGEGCCDYLGIYDGAGTGGTTFFYDYTSSGSGSTMNIGPYTSTGGPITVYFQSDGSVPYPGFELFVSCISTSCGIFNLSLDTNFSESATELHITWDTNGALLYEVEYGPAGFIRGTGTSLSTTLNQLYITGLDTLTSYDVYVRSICPGNDTGNWANGTFTTSLCENSVTTFNFPPSLGSTTTTYSPIGYATYNYSYVQNIIDSAQMADIAGEIVAFSFFPTNTTANNYWTNMTVYMANVPESTLDAGFIHPDTVNHVFVKVIDSANFNFNVAEEQTHLFDTPFIWDGHSNVLFAVNREHGSWTSATSFAAHNFPTSKARYAYQDSGPYNINNVSGGYTLNAVGDIRFFSCGGAICENPVITGIVHDHSTATVTWTGSGTEYEVNIKESASPNWPATDIAVSGTSYTFTGLTPSTNYDIRVRKNCTADSIGYSDWVIDGFLTDNLPCYVPSNLHSTAVTNNTADLDWTVNGNESIWDIHVWYGTYDSTYRVNTRPATVNGLTAGLTYYASIRALCGTDLLEGEWSDTVQFTTAVCPDITGLTTGNVTTNSVTLNWDANPMAQSWTIEYGPSGFTQGQGIEVTSTTNSYVVTGLSDGLTYDFYVKAVCGDDWTSENWVGTSATTQEGGITCNAPTNVTANVNANNVNLSWTPGEGNTSFEIEYGDHGFSHGSGQVATTSATSYALTGLAYNTQYDVYVRGICDQSTYSDWSSVATFTTGEVGIDEVSGVTCTIYPNPTSSATTISVSGVNGMVRIAVVDMNGRTVATETLECSADCEKTMEVDKLAQGAYFVRITADNTNMVRKLIVR